MRQVLINVSRLAGGPAYLIIIGAIFYLLAIMFILLFSMIYYRCYVLFNHGLYYYSCYVL
jgi:hypothetical protein